MEKERTMKAYTEMTKKELQTEYEQLQAEYRKFQAM